MLKSSPVHLAEEGIQKAAVLLMALEEDDAAMLLSKLPAKYVEAVSLAIAQIDDIPGQVQEEVIEEFFGGAPSSLIHACGGLERAKTLVKKRSVKMPPTCSRFFSKPLNRSRSRFYRRRSSKHSYVRHGRTPANDRGRDLPRTGCNRAGILNGLPQQKQLAVIRRIAQMGQTSPRRSLTSNALWNSACRW